MKDRILLGVGRRMLPIPRVLWRRAMAANARKMRAGLAFMSPDHHRVRDFTVTELPRRGTPLSAATIASSLRLPIARVGAILDELDARHTFVSRNPAGEVTWAYPVTIDPTPHQAHFSSGEEAFSP